MHSITTSQVLFLIVLAMIALGIMAFGVYVASITMWGVSQRWQARKRPHRY